MTAESELERFTDTDLVNELQRRCDISIVAMYRHDRNESGESAIWANGKTMEVRGLAISMLFDLLAQNVESFGPQEQLGSDDD